MPQMQQAEAMAEAKLAAEARSSAGKAAQEDDLDEGDLDESVSQSLTILYAPAHAVVAMIGTLGRRYRNYHVPSRLFQS